MKRRSKTNIPVQSRVTVRCWENQGPVRLSELLPWCLREHKVDTLLVSGRAVVDQRGRDYFESRVDQAAKAILGGRLLRRFRASGWPGTEIVNGYGRIYIAQFDRSVMQKLIEIEDDLFNWTRWPRGLPDDVCLFRTGSRFPLLVSVTHEKQAFVLDDRGLHPPGFKKSDSLPEALYIWDGPYFCRDEPPSAGRPRKQA